MEELNYNQLYLKIAPVGGISPFKLCDEICELRKILNDLNLLEIEESDGEGYSDEEEEDY